jgi:hypothetical protein
LTLSVFESESEQKYKNKYNIGDIRIRSVFIPSDHDEQIKWGAIWRDPLQII